MPFRARWRSYGRRRDQHELVVLGGSYDAVKVNHDLGGNATSQVYSDSTLAAFGEAGPAASFHDTDSTLAPEGQLGYFSRFNDSLWLWGAKFSYAYLGTDLATDRDILPRKGSFTTTGTGGPTTPFKGNVVVGSSQTSIDQQMAFMPFVGRAFKNSYVYIGGGPALFDTHSRIANAVGLPTSMDSISISPARLSAFRARSGVGRRRANWHELLFEPGLVSRHE
jgi:hypothetical protein